tara:strand:+ start:23 stop:148 length:126 start_codon:yes stop_codon:yes gene_type:complete
MGMLLPLMGVVVQVNTPVECPTQHPDADTYQHDTHQPFTEG